MENNKMKTLVAIPSKNRVDIFKRYAMNWLPFIKTDWLVFVEPQDYEKYKEFLPENRLINIGQNNKGLAFVKKIIQMFASENGYQLIFKVDDDTAGWTNFRKHLPYEESAAYFEEMLKSFERDIWPNPLIKALAFPYDFHLFNKLAYQKVKKCQSCYLVRTEYLTTDYDFCTFEDYAVGLNILVKGGVVLKCNLMAQEVGVPVGGGTGGMQDFDRSEHGLREAEMLRKIYPPLKFKKVDKPWKIEPDVRSIKL